MGKVISKIIASADGLNSGDIIIAVVGQTGSGKSTFINTAAGTPLLEVEHRLRANINAVKHIVCQGEQHRVVFVDTPALDSCLDPEVITKLLKDWLKSVSSKKLKIFGILYLHRISDDRLPSPPWNHLLQLRSLCEESQQGFPNRVILVTTMWKRTPEEKALLRETELKNYWNNLPLKGSRVMRFKDSADSAWEIVQALQACDTMGGKN